jgi:SET domain-containing protein
LHRSKTNPNCQVVELEDDEGGESYMAVVTLRDIKAGEFFSILDSDDEDDSDNGEEDELNSGGGGEESDCGEEVEQCLPRT